MKWRGYAAVVKGMLTPTVSVQAHESSLLFSTIIARALGAAMFTYLMILREASLTQGRGLIKSECHSVSITIVRGIVWLPLQAETGFVIPCVCVDEMEAFAKPAVSLLYPKPDITHLSYLFQIQLERKQPS